MRELRIRIDPGKNGCLAIRFPDGNISIHPFTSESEMKEALGDLMAYVATEDDILIDCILEQVNSMPGEGHKGAFTFGCNYGFWRGVLQGLEIPFREVRPQRWQAQIGMSATGTRKLKGVERKRALKQLAAERFPKERVTLATCDALLMLDAIA